MNRELIEVVPTGPNKGKLHFKFHPGQMRAWLSEARIILALAGWQSGKSEIGPAWLYREIKAKGPGDYLVASPTFPLMRKKVLPSFLRLFYRKLRLGTYSTQAKIFTFSDYGCNKVFEHVPDDPVQVFFGHAQDPESLESATVKAAWCDEAGQKAFRLASYETVLGRLSIHQGRLLLTTRPYDLGWLKTEVYDRWKRQEPGYDVVNFRSIDNPAFPRAEYERARATLPSWRFRMLYDGLFERPAGLVYDCFDQEKHVWPAFTPHASWPRFGGLDFGGVNTAAVFCCEEQDAGNMPTGRYFIYREYGPVGSKTAKEHATDLLKDEPRLPLMIGGAASEGQWRDEFAAAGLPVLEPPIRDIEVGIGRVYAAIKSGKLLIMDNCKKLLDEVASYSRELDEQGNPTEKIEAKETYHVLDSLRYLCAYLFPGEGDWGTWDLTQPPEARNPVMDAPPGVFLS